MISMNIRSMITALATPDALRGRVNAVESVFISASNELGAFESGAAAALVGAVPAVVIGGSLTIAAALLWPRLYPAMARIDRLERCIPRAGHDGGAAATITARGAIAQLGERLVRTQEVGGSSPPSSIDKGPAKAGPLLSCQATPCRGRGMPTAPSTRPHTSRRARSRIEPAGRRRAGAAVLAGPPGWPICVRLGAHRP